MNQIVTKPKSELQAFSDLMDRMKSQLTLALPKHLNADRMARLAVTAFSTTPALRECKPQSIVASIMTAATLGLECNVNGQGYLIPYKGVCQFVPGWKGLQDIANRSGRSSTWTGAVFAGDDFDYAMGDRPFITHRPGDNAGIGLPTHVYAVGRIKDADWPVIEVWSMNKVKNHLGQYNKVGTKHYAHANENNMQMYARKLVLLQVLKYMPASIELNQAVEIASAQESGKHAVIDGDFVSVTDQDEGGPAEPQIIPTPTAKAKTAAPPTMDSLEPKQAAKSSESIDLDGEIKPSAQALTNLTNDMKFKQVALVDACEAAGVTLPCAIEDLSIDAFTAVSEWVKAQ